MTQLKRGTVPIDSIIADTFVRVRVDDEHVLHLACLYEGGTKLPPIKVLRAGSRLIDGRHRLKALKMLEKTTVEVEWVEEADTANMLVQALQANIGGSLPPSNTDIVYAMQQMMEAGMVNSAIAKQFSSYWPPSVIRKFINDAASALYKTRMVRAKAAVIDDGMTLTEAAQANGVKVDQLKNHLGGKKTRKTAVGDINGQISKAFKSRGQQVAGVLKNVQQKFDDGDLSWNAIDHILAHCEKAHKSHGISLRDWRTRFEAKAGKLKK